MRQVYSFFLEERGATAVEYGLLVGLIALAIVGTASAMFNSLHNPFGRVSEPFTR
jgi:pilus assembly protein Flp/PilA